MANVEMPTYSIGSPSIFQANASSFNTTYQHYQSFASDGYNLTDGEYTYSIPDSFNSNYITIYYNPAWTIDYASYGFAPGVQATSSGTMPYLTFAGVSGIGTITMTFTEPLVIGQPLGTMSLGVLPSIAVDGNAFFELPNDLLHWTANGVPINPSGFSVVVGKPVTINAYMAGSNDPIYSTTYTPTKQITFLQTYVNISEFQFNNLNSTDEVSITATNANGTTQAMPLIGPYGTGASSQVVYLPSGKYTFRYTQLNYTSGEVVPGTSTATSPLANYSGEYWVTLSGVTIFQLGNQLKYTNSSIQKSIQSLSVIIALNDSAIKNLTLAINANLTVTNSSLKDYMTKVLVNESTIHSEVQNYSTDIQATDNIINATVHLVSNNITLFQNYVKDYINATINNIKLEENFMNDTINKVNNNITLFQTYVKTTINATLNNVQALDTFINSTVKRINNNVTLDEQFVNDTVHSVSNNLTLFNNYVHTTINATINNIQVITSVVNSTVHDVSNNITLFNNYVHDVINATITDIHAENLIINSTVHAVSTNLSLFQTYVKDTINTTLTDVNLRDKYINDTVGVISNNVSLLQTYTKDVIHSEINNLSVVTKYINDTLGNLNISFNDKVAILNSTLNNMNLNSTSYFNIIHSIVSSINLNSTQRYALEEQAGAYAYHFVPKNVTRVQGGVDIQAYLENQAGRPVDNAALVLAVWKNVTMEYINLTDRTQIRPVLITYNSYSVSFFLPLNSSQLVSLLNGKGGSEVAAISPFAIGNVNDVATGDLTPSTFQPVLPAYLRDLGFKTVPPGGFLGDVKWFFGSITGVLTGTLLGAIVMLYYLRSIIKDIRKERREEAEREREEKRKREEERRLKNIERMLKGDDAE